MIKRLLNIWEHSDSQPTEITLGICNFILTPLATIIELGLMPVFNVLLVLVGLFQLFAVANGCINYRVRAAFLSFTLFIITLSLYIICCGLKDASHYGWVVLVISSFGSLRRLKKEQLHGQRN